MSKLGIYCCTNKQVMVDTFLFCLDCVCHTWHRLDGSVETRSCFQWETLQRCTHGP